MKTLITLVLILVSLNSYSQLEFIDLPKQTLLDGMKQYSDYRFNKDTNNFISYYGPEVVAIFSIERDTVTSAMFVWNIEKNLLNVRAELADKNVYTKVGDNLWKLNSNKILFCSLFIHDDSLTFSVIFVGKDAVGDAP
jgi:hypothetical protein